MLRANRKIKTAKEFRLVCAVDVAQAVVAAGDTPAKLPTFRARAYNGGAMNIDGFPYPVVINLAKLRAGKTVPMLLDHEHTQIVGQADHIDVGTSGVTLAGTITGNLAVEDSPASIVVGHAKNGFQWAVSVGVSIDLLEFVADGATTKVNNKQFKGPLYVVQSGLLYETSFLSVGADEAAYAKIAASAAKEITVDFEQWLTANGFDSKTLTEKQRTALQAAHAATLAPPGEDGNGDPTPAPPDPKKVEAAPATEGEPKIISFEAHRKQLADEARRVAQINKVCAGKADMIAKAIEEGWTAEKAELEAMRADRPTTSNIRTGAPVELDAVVLEAALAKTLKLPDREKQYDARTLEAADKRFRGPTSLHRALLYAARANGYAGDGDVKSSPREILAYAFGVPQRGVKATAFSSLDISGILSNVANKFLMAGYNAVERTWRAICAVKSATDFKTMSSYRLTSGGKYQKVGASGELKHGTLGEQVYTNKVDTYGVIYAITRQDILNDDLDAISSVPQRIGRDAAVAMNEVFWAVFLNDAAFFSSGNGNYITGAGTALKTNPVDNMTAIVKKFLELKDAAGKPLGTRPAILLTPPDQLVAAKALYTSQEIRDTTANTKAPVGNPYINLYRPEWSVYLATVFGGLDSAYYLLADPNDIPVIEMAFLNGREEPIIETADADFDNLGIQMRGYHDFGAALVDPRGGVKCKGAA